MIYKLHATKLQQIVVFVNCACVCVCDVMLHWCISVCCMSHDLVQITIASMQLMSYMVSTIWQHSQCPAFSSCPQPSVTPVSNLLATMLLLLTKVRVRQIDPWLFAFSDINGCNSVKRLSVQRLSNIWLVTYSSDSDCWSCVCSIGSSSEHVTV